MAGRPIHPSRGPVLSQGRAFFLCVLPALSPVRLASEGEARAEHGAPTPAAEHGTAALFAWGDADGDGRLDLAAVSLEGELQLLASLGDGRFEEVTERVGLAEVEQAALAAWADYDGDGRLDLFVGARRGSSWLFHNEGGAFDEASSASGIACAGPVRSAQWLDHDGDGRLDLFLVAEEAGVVRSSLFRGLTGGYFERTELPLEGRVELPCAGARVVPVGGEDAAPPAASAAHGTEENRSPDDERRAHGRPRKDGASLEGAEPRLRPAPESSSIVQGLSVASGCAQAIADQAKPGACLQASSIPALGKLYPLSGNLFVAVGGNVGIGTTSPSAKLHVAGTARMTDKLTLAPSGDVALDVSTGSIYKAGAPFLHTRGGAGTTALGSRALGSVTSGSRNTAQGDRALFADTTGSDNSASGYRALSANTVGNGNTAHGSLALFANTTGKYNTASGYGALYSNTGGSSNTAVGDSALLYNTTGAGNVAVGAGVLAHNTTAKYNTATGSSALFLNTIGEGNTASGAFTLFSNTSGAFNTASGYGALYSNTQGSDNTASGDSALLSNTTGSRNTACGARALASNSTGNDNAACGDSALLASTIGKNNAALGAYALTSNTTGSGNSACGRKALYSNTTGVNNTACGNAALFYNTTGGHNVALGAGAGLYWTTGSANIAIGNYGMPGDTATTRIGAVQTRTFIAGIRGATTAIANAIPVLIDSAGQLGTTFSSRRFKEDIRDMGAATARLLELRPVLFRYKQAQTLPGGQALPPEYGLIAEEVAEILPDLVVYDDEGQPLTVKYHLLSAMLLNELQRIEADRAREMAELRVRIEVLEGYGPTAREQAPRQTNGR